MRAPNRDNFTIQRRALPHWRLEGAVYFVTFGLHPSQPNMTAEERGMVLSSLRHFDGDRYSLGAWVVMDDHSHAIVKPHGGNTLSSVTHGWKSFTAHRFTRDFGRLAPVWQSESLDRIVRDEAELAKFRQYILDNPEKRWPGVRAYEWVGSATIEGF